MQQIFTLVKQGEDVRALASLDRSEFQHLARDKEQETPLWACLRNPKGRGALTILLENGAARSIFVKGYAPDSLVCALPMAEQPESSVHLWPPPISIDAERLHVLDTALAYHIAQMAADAVRRKAEQAIEKKRFEDAEKKAATLAASAPKVTFEHYPDTLVVGNIVRRGPDWSYSDQDVDSTMGNGVKHAGTWFIEFTLAFLIKTARVDAWCKRLCPWACGMCEFFFF